MQEKDLCKTIVFISVSDTKLSVIRPFVKDPC
jgi:hypothetical protein